jgi:hypothetical protein
MSVKTLGKMIRKLRRAKGLNYMRNKLVIE